MCTYAKMFFLHICKLFFEKKSRFFGIFFATGLAFERFLAPRCRFFEKVNGLGVLGLMQLLIKLDMIDKEFVEFKKFDENERSMSRFFLSKHLTRNSSCTWRLQPELEAHLIKMKYNTHEIGIGEHVQDGDEWWWFKHDGGGVAAAIPFDCGSDGV
ncbi:hypothetical protein LXL04_034680 [Taraxacum kok-saghyz]